MACAYSHFDMNAGWSDLDTNPQSAMSTQGIMVLTEEFSPGLLSPIDIVIDNYDQQEVKDSTKVLQADIAEDDLKNIIEYIADDSLLKAQQVFDKITKKASSLYILPERGRLVPELKDQGILQYREIIHSPWRIIYRISEHEVYVLAVLDSRRNIEDILLKRLLNREI